MKILNKIFPLILVCCMFFSCASTKSNSLMTPVMGETDTILMSDMMPVALKAIEVLHILLPYFHSSPGRQEADKSWFPVSSPVSLQLQCFLVLFLFAIVAFQHAVFLVDDVEDGGHWLVVGDALRVTALHDSLHHIRHDDLFLFHHFVIADDVQLHIGSHYREAADFFVAEETVGYLDDAFLAQFLAWQVIADSDVQVRILQTQQAYNGEELVGRYMVNNGAVL